MVLKKTFLLFCITLISYSYGQNHLIEEKYHEKVRHFATQSTDSANYYIAKMQESANPCRMFFGHYYKANYLYFNNKYTESENVLNKLLKLIDTTKSKNFKPSKLLASKNFNECTFIVKINILRRFFYLKSRQEQLDSAFYYLKKRQLLVEKSPDKNNYYLRELIDVKRAIALMKLRVNDVKEALSEIKNLELEMDLIKIDENDFWYTNFIKQKATTHRIKGNIYFKMKQISKTYLDSSEIAYTKADKIEMSLKDEYDDTIKKDYLITLSYILYEKGELKKLKNNIGKLDSLPFSNITYGKNDLDFLKASYMYKVKVFDSAVYYSKLYIKFLDSTANTTLTSTRIVTYNILTNSFYNLKNTDSAYKYSNLAIADLNEINKIRNNTLINLNKDELDNIHSLNKKIQKEQSVLKSYFYAISIVLVLTLCVSAVYFKKHKAKQNAKYLALFNRYKNIKVKPKNNETKNIHINEHIVNTILLGLEKIEDSNIFIDKEFNLRNLAKLLETNTSYVSKTINKHKGKSFKNYLTELRMDYLIKELDRNPKIRKYTIKALGEHIGYTNGSAFTRAFKIYKGTSPLKFIDKRYS